MTRYDEVTWCDGCGVEITWGPVLVDSRAYCCRECSHGIPCRCGERRHCSAELAKEWILHERPRYDIPYEYVLFKPLRFTTHEENLRAVIFPLNPVELGGLVTLAGSVMTGTDPVQIPQGADCNSITSFVYAQADLSAPRAILGMLGVDGREVMRKRFRDDTMTLTLPASLYHRMEQEANDSVLQTPSWRRLADR